MQLALTGAFLGLQFTQPSSELARCIFVDLLLSYNVVTLAVTSLYSTSRFTLLGTILRMTLMKNSRNYFFQRHIFHIGYE